MRKDTYNKLKQISDYLYHASPKDLDILSGDAAVTPDAEGHVFVSPYRSFVSPFIIDKQKEIVATIEEQIGEKHIKINNMRYSSWGDYDRSKGRERLTVYVDTPEEFKPFESEAQGWVYRVALAKVADKLKRWKHSQGEFDEYIIPGDVKFDDKEQAKVKFRVEKYG